MCSSMMDTILIGRPSVVASNWKSTAHTRFGASAAGRRGVSPGDLLQRGLLQLRVGQQTLQRGVLLLQVLQPFGVVGLEPAELVTPAVVRLLGDRQLAADVGDVLAPWARQRPSAGDPPRDPALAAKPLSSAAGPRFPVQLVSRDRGYCGGSDLAVRLVISCRIG